MTKLILGLLLACQFNLSAQQLHRYNHSDTIVEKISTPFFLSEKLVYFDSTYIEIKPNGDSSFKIQKVCDEFGCICEELGCDGLLSLKDKEQIGWGIIENKIFLSYIQWVNDYKSIKFEVKVFKYDHKTGRFLIII